MLWHHGEKSSVGIRDTKQIRGNNDRLRDSEPPVTDLRHSGKEVGAVTV